MDVAEAAGALIRKHPLQRLGSPSRGASAFLHAAALASFAYAFRHLAITPNPINESYGWHFQYLTVLGLSLATLTFAIALLADLLLSPRLFALKNAFAITSAPMEVLVSILYWGLYVIDPNLVDAPHLPRVPVHVNLSLHAFPTLFLALDLILLSPPWAVLPSPPPSSPSSPSSPTPATTPPLSATLTTLPGALVPPALIATAYWFWVSACHARNGFYPYPVFDAVGGPAGRAVLFAGATTVMTAAAVGLGRVQAWVLSRGGRGVEDGKGEGKGE